MKVMYLRRYFFLLVFSFCFLYGYTQSLLPLTDLSYFLNPGDSWKIAGNVNCGFSENAVLSVFPGKGILVAQSDKIHPGRDLLTKQQYGGMDIELDFMMVPGSNSGIYLQGRYEIQLRDSWGKTQPTADDNGGIYDRQAPRQNASRAPGTWQHIRISFQAPRFNATGQKTGNARILKVELNGVLIQDNIELAGPTPGALGNDEVALGPLRLQGNHGSVAFRNIKITPFDSPLPELINLKYALYKSMYTDDTSYLKAKPEVTGNTEKISMNVTLMPPVFLIHFTGKLRIMEPGVYHFGLYISGGRGSLKINNQDVISLGQGSSPGSGNIILPAGEFPFDLVYSKLVTWNKPVVGLEIAGPGIRTFRISDANAGADHENPILVNATVNTIIRSFSDIDSFKVTHAVNVGSPLQINYTYDLDKGMIVQVWRGDFIDASTMWHGRGDGTARPLGMILQFGKPVNILQTLASTGTAWSSDTAGSGFRAKGYILDEDDRPSFRYIIYHAMVNDKTRVMPGSQGIFREISIDNPVAGLYLRLASASSIETLSDGLYLLDDKSYYLRIDDAGPGKPLIRDMNGRMELIIPVSQKISYSILF
jgi:Domain of Unknown Function (DUF1080)